MPSAMHGTRRAQRPEIPPARPSLQAMSLVLTAWLISTAICWSATKMPRAPLSAGSTPRMPRTYFACNRSSREFASSSTRTTTRGISRELRAPISKGSPRSATERQGAGLPHLVLPSLAFAPGSMSPRTSCELVHEPIPVNYAGEGRGMRCMSKWAMATVCYELQCGVLPVAFWTAVHLHADDFCVPNQRRLAP